MVKLGDEAASKKLTPAVGMEYEPFITGYAHNGDWEGAYNLTVKAAELTDNMSKSLCGDWKRLQPAVKSGDTEAQRWFDQAVSTLQCP